MKKLHELKLNENFTCYDADFLLTAIKELENALMEITNKLPIDVYYKHAENISVCYNRIGRLNGRINSISEVN